MTQLGERLLLTAAVFAVLAGVYALMWRSWRRRRDSAGVTLELGDVPVADVLGPARATAEGTYVVTTTAGDWLARVHAHGLGVRGPATMTVHQAGVVVHRVGAADLFVAAAEVRGARLERGMAGMFVEEGGVVVVTWARGNASYDTGFRPRNPDDRSELMTAVTAMTEVRS